MSLISNALILNILDRSSSKLQASCFAIFQKKESDSIPVMVAFSPSGKTMNKVVTNGEAIEASENFVYLLEDEKLNALKEQGRLSTDDYSITIVLEDHFQIGEGMYNGLVRLVGVYEDRAFHNERNLNRRESSR